MTTKEFATWFSTIEGLTVTSIEEDKIYFLISKESLVVKRSEEHTSELQSH